MSGLFELDSLSQRLRAYVQRSTALKPEAAGLLEEALIRGEFERGEIARITGVPELFGPQGFERCHSTWAVGFRHAERESLPALPGTCAGGFVSAFISPDLTTVTPVAGGARVLDCARGLPAPGVDRC